MENQVDKQYQTLLQTILDYGIEKKDRTGTGTKSIFGYNLRFTDIEHNFPILTTKKMPFKSIVTELLWFLRGDTNIQYLVQNGCNIWNGDAYKNYVDTLAETHSQHYTPVSQKDFIERIKTDDAFAKYWGDLGPIYGKQWRGWYVKGDGEKKWIDQIATLINDLKTNPDSRRLIVSAWNVGELDKMVLPPCHYGFQIYTRELSVEERLDLASKTYKGLFEPFDFHRGDHEEIDELYPVPRRAISLMWNQRSVDTFLGLPFNITSYALLLRIIAKEVNMKSDDLIGNLGDTHLYLNHIEQAKEQLIRSHFLLPGKGDGDDLVLDGTLETYTPDSIKLYYYNEHCHPTIKAPLSN